MRKRRIGLWIAAAVVLGIAAALIYTRPRTLPIPEDEAVSLVWMDERIVVENFAALPKGEARTYRISPDSETYETVASALAGLEYRRCLHTLTGADFDRTEDWGFLLWQDQKVLVA